MGEHSRFGGSSAYRWMNCPGSVALLGTVPAKPSSKYAEEGTLAHEFAAYMLANGERDISSYIGATLGAKVGATPLTQEMAEAIQVYLDAVWAEFDRSPDAEFYVEKGFVLEVESADQGEVFGTNDAMVYHPSTGRLVVFDYKHGQGVSVSAEDNPQLKFYAAGAVFSNDWKLSEVVLTIVQPRARDAIDLGAVREWPMDAIELLEFKGEIRAAITCAKSPSARCIAGTWCDKTFCDARTACPAYQAMQLAGTGFETVDLATVDTADLPEPKTLTPERLSQIVEGASRLQAWVNQCQEYLEALLMGGTAVPGWKVVEKIGRARWISNEETVAAELAMLYDLDEDLIRPRKLTTITEVEKLMKQAGASKVEIDNFKLQNTLKESSGPTIAPNSDKRPAINLAELSFGSVKE